jgi:spore coat protein H
MLDAKINEVKEELTAERIKGLLSEYQPLIKTYALQMPDLQYLPTNAQGIEQDLEVMPAEVQNNYELYLASLQAPLPFYLGTPVIENAMLKFPWSESYDFAGQEITYRFSIARDPALQETVFTKTVSGSTSVLIEPLEAGEYFWSVTAVNASGKTQLPFDHLYDANGLPRSGLKRFSILPDGQVEENHISK